MWPPPLPANPFLLVTLPRGGTQMSSARTTTKRTVKPVARFVASPAAAPAAPRGQPTVPVTTKTAPKPARSSKAPAGPAKTATPTRERTVHKEKAAPSTPEPTGDDVDLDEDVEAPPPATTALGKKNTAAAKDSADDLKRAVCAALKESGFAAKQEAAPAPLFECPPERFVFYDAEDLSVTRDQAESALPAAAGAKSVCPTIASMALFSASGSSIMQLIVDEFHNVTKEVAAAFAATLDAAGNLSDETFEAIGHLADTSLSRLHSGVEAIDQLHAAHGINCTLERLGRLAAQSQNKSQLFAKSFSAGGSGVTGASFEQAQAANPQVIAAMMQTDAGAKAALDPTVIGKLFYDKATPAPRTTASSSASKASSNSRDDLQDIECYNCNKFGHYASNCKQTRRSRYSSSSRSARRRSRSRSSESRSASRSASPKSKKKRGSDRNSSKNNRRRN